MKAEKSNYKTSVTGGMILPVVIFMYGVLLAEEGFYLLGTMTGKGENDCYYHVAGVGDVNGDGYDDAMVGASAGNYAHLFLGSTDFDTIPDVVFRPTVQGATYGTTICGDDWNGDGYNDIAIGEPHWCVGDYPNAILEAGKVWVYFGGSQIDTIPDLELVVGNMEDFTGWYYRFGKSVASGGDVNGDGYHDLIVGAPHDDYDAHGRVYIYFGGPHMDEEYDVLLEGEGWGDMFGCSLDIAGDINQDGYDDLLIGASQDLKQEDGQAYLVYGGEEISLTNSVLFEGDSTKVFGSFGRVVAGLGDINGDNIDDFGIMGLDYIYIAYGPNLTIYKKTTDDIWGSFNFLHGGFDLNQDEFNDFLIGVGNRAEQYKGMIIGFMGNDPFNMIPDLEISGKIINGYFGYEICRLGDVNNDDKNDFIVGEELSGKGKAYIFTYGETSEISKETQNSINKSFKITQNYPNPFNVSTTIEFTIDKPGDVILSVYDIRGNLVSILENNRLSPGNYRYLFNAENLSAGIYFYRLNHDGDIMTRKMVYLK